MTARTARLADLQAQLSKAQAEREIYHRLYLNASTTLDSCIASTELTGNGTHKAFDYLKADRAIRAELHALDNKEIRK